MARPDLSGSTTNRANWNGSDAWNNSAGDWWDATPTAQGSTAWASTVVTDTDTARSITFDLTTWAQAVYDNANWTSAVLLRATGGSINLAMLADGTASNRPKISYDGGAVQYATDTVVISPGSAGGTDGASFTPLPLSAGDAERLLIEFPEPSTRPTSATMTLYTTAQFSDTTVNVFWLRYPPESAPTLGSIPTAPSGVTVGSVTPFGATVSWTDNSADETGFIVRYAVSPYTSFTTASTTASTNAVSYVLSGLTDNTPYKADVAARNAIGTSTAVVSGTFTTLALTRLRTNADTSKGVWTASTGTALYAMIDEASFSDADYITAASASTCKLKFENSTDPADDSNHRIAVRARATSGVLTMQLIQGDPAETTIASTAITASTAFAEYGLTLTTAQAATITDYADLYVKLISS